MIEIRQEKMSDQFTKYHLEGLPFSAVLHHFTDSDKGYPHDHPFGFTTHILKGSYVEKIYYPDLDSSEVIHRKQGSSHFVAATLIHEIIELPDGDCWTIITPEKWERQPHFWKFENGIWLRAWDETEFKPYK